jgi:hypothetical protein
MRRFIAIVLGVMLCATILAGCTESTDSGTAPTGGNDNSGTKPKGGISLTVTDVEKRRYGDSGDSASQGNIFVYVFFNLANNGTSEISVNPWYFEATIGGIAYTYSMYCADNCPLSSIQPGYYSKLSIGFEVPEAAIIDTKCTLTYDNFYKQISTNFANIQSGFHDIFLVTLSNCASRQSNAGEYSWETPAEGNVYVYIDLTLSNSKNNTESISTGQYYFKLHTSDGTYDADGCKSGIPSELAPGKQASYYIYFEVPQNTVLEKLVYDTYNIAPAEWIFE